MPATTGTNRAIDRLARLPCPVLVAINGKPLAYLDSAVTSQKPRRALARRVVSEKWIALKTLSRAF